MFEKNFTFHFRENFSFCSVGRSCISKVVIEKKVNLLIDNNYTYLIKKFNKINKYLDFLKIEMTYFYFNSKYVISGTDDLRKNNIFLPYIPVLCKTWQVYVYIYI